MRTQSKRRIPAPAPPNAELSALDPWVGFGGGECPFSPAMATVESPDRARAHFEFGILGPLMCDWTAGR